MSKIDRRAVRIILALCDLEVSDFAECLGYEPGYVSNVLTGQTRPSPAFSRAFGDTIAQIVGLGHTAAHFTGFIGRS